MPARLSSQTMRADGLSTATPRILLAKPLTPEAFAPFGHVVSPHVRPGKDANQGTALRVDYCAPLLSTRPSARANLVAVRAMPQVLPFRLRLLEHHPCSTQTFIPMICERYLVVVTSTSPDGTPDLGALTAFECGPGQGISYGVGVWHHPIAALFTPAEFVMLVWEDNTIMDCVERPLEEEICVTLAQALPDEPKPGLN